MAEARDGPARPQDGTRRWPQRDRVAVAKLTGGLGNQLFQYAAARALCLREGRRLLLAWLGPTDGSRRYLLDQFRRPGPPEVSLAGADDLRRLWAARPRWQRRLIRRGLWPGHQHLRDSRTGFRPLAGSARSLFLDGYFQSWRYFDDCADRIRSEFAILAEPDARNAELLGRIAAGNAVCIHIRRGDYLALPRHGVLPLDYYRAALDRLAPVLDGARFYVFSDDPAWVRAHFDLGRPFEPVDCNGPDAPVADLALMAACRHFVIANSTLSWWGAWLAAHPGKRVIAPRRWFAAHDADTTDLCPPDWQRL
ncbi:MAG: alpha-1,2-fucosyltransferase [Bauldia sp.]|nr:alpha-1,2-fucosyltransferase [Bauldia sp.]